MRSSTLRLALGGALLSLLALSCAGPVNVEVEPPEPEKSRLSGRIPPVGPYSAGIEYGSLVFLAGQIALDHEGGGLVEGGIAEQTHQVMQNLQAVLVEAGLGFGDVVRSGVFLADVNDFGAMNEVYASYFPEGAIPPVRTTVAVAGIPLGALLEIDMIAVR